MSGKTHWSDTVKSSMIEDYAKLLRVARAAKKCRELDDSSSFSISEYAFADLELHEALKAVEHLQESE